jgi:23S rRNA (guanosine2251-2'-O)-methyltransferase
VVEGRQAVRELLRAGRRRVHQVTIAEGRDLSGPLAEIIELARAQGVAVRRIDRAQLIAQASTDSPQGVMARADPIPEADLDTLAARRIGVPAPFLVVLDGVTDPHNLGAVMRSALSAGATGLVTGRHRSARLTPAAMKAAAGAVEYLRVATAPGIPAALSALAAAGVWTVALDAGAPQRLWGLQVAAEPVALVLGAEGRGLSRLVRQRCDLVVDIPLAGPIESLNVAAAATLACFEVARVRAGGGPAPRLPSPGGHSPR